MRQPHSQKTLKIAMNKTYRQKVAEAVNCPSSAYKGTTEGQFAAKKPHLTMKSAVIIGGFLLFYCVFHLTKYYMFCGFCSAPFSMSSYSKLFSCSLKKSYQMRTFSSSVHERHRTGTESRSYTFAPFMERRNGEWVDIINWQL